jgi:hypothetical protein
MSDHSSHPPRSHRALDALITQLIECDGVLSQIIAHMTECQAAGLSAPEAPAPYVVLHDLLMGVLAVVAKRHRRTEIEMASALLDEITETICAEVLFVDLDELSS